MKQGTRNEKTSGTGKISANTQDRRQQRRMVEFRRQQQDIYGRKYGFRIPLYFGWEIIIGAGQLHDRRPHIVRPFRSYRAFTITIAILTLAIITGGVLFTNKNIRAATYTWVQSAWTGGATANIGVHPTNQTGWNQYAAKDANVVASATVGLATQAATIAHTSDADFSPGTAASTVVSGSGSGASVQLNSTFTESSTLSGSVANGMNRQFRKLTFDTSRHYTWAVTYASPWLNYKIASDGTYVSYNTCGNGSTKDLLYDAVNDVLWQAGSSKQICKISPVDGSVLATYTFNSLPESIQQITFDPVRNLLWFDVPLSYAVYSISATTGALGGPYSYAGITPERSYIDGSCGFLPVHAVLYDPSTQLVWTTTCEVWNDGDGYPYAADIVMVGMDAATGTRVRTKTLTDPSPFNPSSLTPFPDTADTVTLTYVPTAASKKIWVTALDTTVARFDPTNGSFSYFTTTAPANHAVYDAYHTAVWITTTGNYSFFRYSVEGDAPTTYDGRGLIAGNDLVTPSGCVGGVYDPDNRNLWLCDWKSNSPTSYGVVRFQYQSSFQYAALGTYTSPIIDTSGNTDFSTTTWSDTLPVAGTVITMKVRTSSDPTMAGATAFSDPSCTNISKGQDITASGCVTDGHRYVQYQATLTTNDTTKTPSLNDITLGYTTYASGTLTSSIFNTGDSTNAINNVQWTSTGSGTVKFQLRAAASSGGVSGATWVGSDGTNSTYFTAAAGNTIPNILKTNAQYFQYKVFLEPQDGGHAPTLTSVTSTYLVNAPPEFEAPPSVSQNSDGTVSISYSVRDPDTSGGVVTPNEITPRLQYSLDGTNWNDITAPYVSAGTLSNKVVEQVNYRTYATTWNARGQTTSFSTTTKIRVQADDNEGANHLATIDSANFTLDTKNPTLTATPITVDASTTPATVTLGATDDSALQMCVTLDNTQSNCVAYNATAAITLTTDPDTVYVIFKDAFGNTSSATAVTPQTPNNLIIRDLTNVTTSEYQLFITWGATSLPTNQFARYEVYHSTTGADGSYAMISTITDKTTNYYFHKSLVAGSTHYYRITTVDANGNESYLSSAINTIANGQGGGTDVVAPLISNVAISSVTTQSALVTWDTDELSNSTVGYSTTAANFTTEVGVATMLDRASGSGRHAVVLNNLTPNTTYYLRVRSTDPSGNIASDTNGGDGFILSTVAGPVISNVTTSSIDNTSATISWRTNVAADSTVIYSTNADMSSPLTMTSATAVTDHAVQLTGLTLGTKYYFEVQSGVALDPNAGLFYSFTTTQDGTAPTISNIVVSPITDTEAVVTWTTNERATSQVAYGTSSGSYPAHSTLDSSLNLQHAVTLTGLTTHTTYYFTVTSVDASTNSSTSGEQTFQTHYTLVEQTPSATPPVMSGLTVQPITDTQAVVQWSTDVASTTRVDYGTAAGQLLQHVGPDGVFNKTHAITVPSLTAHTTYYYTATSVDQWGNTVTSNEQTFTTLYSLVEQTPTSTPPSLTSISADPVTDVTALIHWVSSTPASTQLRYGTSSGSYTTTTTLDASLNLTHTVVLTGLTPITTYYYVVTSVDQWGNAASSAEKSFTTAEATITMSQAQALIDAAKNASTDTAAPVISNIVSDTITTSSAVIHWTTDESANSFVQFGVSATDQTIFGNWVFSDVHTINLRQLSPATTYTYNVVSADKHGNTSTSTTASFTTSALPTTTLESQLNDQVQAIQQQAQRLPGPVIGGQPKIDATTNGATVTWTTDKAANGFVAIASDTDYSKTFTYSQSIGNPETIGTTHQVSIQNLLPDTLYHVQVRSTSTLGQQTSTADITFRTLKKIFEIENYSVSTPATDQAIFRWTTSEAAGASIQIVPYRNNVRAVDELKTITDDTKSLIHQVSISNLEPAVRYNVELISVNAAGQRATKTVDAFSTSASSLPPLITNIHVDSALSPGEKVKVQTIVSWTTNTPSTSQVFYREGVGKADAELPNKTELDLGYTKRHIVVITSFNPGSVYQLRVESKDSNAQVSTSKPLTMLTPQQERTVFQVISGAAQQIFGWTGAFKK